MACLVNGLSSGLRFNITSGSDPCACKTCSMVISGAGMAEAAAVISFDKGELSVMN